jgi:hypothetical protein
MTSLRSPGSLASPARRISAMVLAAVQLLLVFAALSEVRDEPGGRRHPNIAVREGVASSEGIDQRARHDEATCPACIVRSLHAQLEALAPLPVLGTELPTAALLTSASIPRINLSFSNYSRAPPVVG